MEPTNRHQFVGLGITRKKFDRELAAFEVQRESLREKGIICLEQSDFRISFLFGVPHLNPMAIAFAVQIDYTNWDVEPPSLRFINAFTGKPVSGIQEIPIAFFQSQNPHHPNAMNGAINELNLLQGNSYYPPFFCIPGVKEYHDHFAHSGDLWMSHRTKGEGKLLTILEQLWKHSVAQAGGYNTSIHQLQQIQVDQNVLGFQIVVQTSGIKTDPKKLT